MRTAVFSLMHTTRKLGSHLFKLSSSLEWQAWVVFSYAMLAMLYVQAFYPFFHPGGDSDWPLFMARYLLRMKGGLYIADRGPGMALFVIFTGVVFGTWKIMILAYAFMSVAIPCMIYGMIRPYTKVGALIVAFLVTISAIPYAYSKVDSYDHLFLFLEFASFFLIAIYFYNPQRFKKLPFIILFTLLALNLTKPIGAFLFWIYFVCALFVPNVNRKILIGSGLLYIALMAIWVGLDRNFGNSAFPRWLSLKTIAERRFAETYFQPSHFSFAISLKGAPVISSEDGPASNALISAVRKYAYATKSIWGKPSDAYAIYPGKLHPPQLFKKYLNNPNGLVNAIFRTPNAFYFAFIKSAAYKTWGKHANEKLYTVAKEHGHTDFPGFVRYLFHRPTKLLTGASVSMGWRNLLAIYSFAPLRKAYSWYELIEPNAIPTSMITPNAGVYSKEFYSAINFFITDLPQFWEHSNTLFESYSGKPEKLYRAIANPQKVSSSPNNQHFLFSFPIIEGWYYTMFLNVFGPTYSNELFIHVAKEVQKKYPASILFFIDNFLKETLVFYKIPNLSIPLGKYIISWITGPGAISYKERTNSFVNLGTSLSKELQPKIYANSHSELIATLYNNIHIMAPFFVIIMLLVLALALVGPARYFALFLFLTYLYFVSVFSVFGNFGSARYSDIFILIPLILIALGIGSIPKIRK